MIKAKITGKAGRSLKRELPLDIHQLYHDMREAGISKPPKISCSTGSPRSGTWFPRFLATG